MRSDSEKNMSAYADQNHVPSLTDVRLELTKQKVDDHPWFQDESSTFYFRNTFLLPQIRKD